MQYKTLHIVQEKHLDDMNDINKMRKIMASGKCMLLKDQTIITTEVIYKQVKAYEKATEKWRNAKGHTKRKSRLQVILNSTNDMKERRSIGCCNIG
jgi:hypothetical protein